MKKIIFVIVLLLISFSADARMCGVMLSGSGTASEAPAGCTLNSGNSCAAATDGVTAGATGEYVGNGNYYPSANMNLCQIDFWVTTRPGEGNVTVYVFEMSGTSLGTEVCHTETKAYSDLTNNAWNSFAITGDCNIVAGGSTKYGIVMLLPGSAELGDRTVSGGCTTNGGDGLWLANKSISASYYDGYDTLMRLYAK